MSTYLGNTLISGVGRHTESNAHTLLDFKWSDHIINSMEWLRADTFSWQSGDVYQAVYNHLSADITGKSLQSETISGITIQYYLADDGHKIAPASEETNVNNLFNTTGVAWYYILDTVNTRFKLPRSKPLSDGVKGDGVALGFTDGSTGYGMFFSANLANDMGSGYFGKDVGTTNQYTSQPSAGKTIGITTDSSKSGIMVERNNDSQHKYLYFYVGQYTQSAIEQTAGITSEELNGKVDKDSSWGFPSDTYIDLTLGASDSKYVPPANGFLYLAKTTNSTNQYVQLSIGNPSTDSAIMSIISPRPNSGAVAAAYIPCRKGVSVYYSYTAGGATKAFRFVYAVGSEP